MEEVDYSVFAKQIPNLLPINVRLACAGPSVRSHHEDFGVRLAMLHQLDPLFHEALLRTLAWLPHHQIDCRRAEEQLVRRPINSLAAEVPAVQGDLSAGRRILYFHRLDLDS